MSSKGFPSLAIVVERLRVICGINLDCRKVDLPSCFEVNEASLPLDTRPSLLPELLIRKKFLIFWETWLLEPLTCLLFETGLPKDRFSLCKVVLLLAPKNCVILQAEREIGMSSWFRNGEHALCSCCECLPGLHCRVKYEC